MTKTFLSVFVVSAAFLVAQENTLAEQATVEVNLAFSPNELSKSTRPQDDFYQYVNGPWITSNQIPQNRSAIGTWLTQYERTQEQIRAIIENACDDEHQCDNLDDAVVNNLYASFVDVQAIEALGLSPIKQWISRIEALEVHSELPSLFGGLAQIGIEGLFRAFVYNDADNPKRLRLYLLQSGITLPGRDYYLSANEEHASIRSSFRSHLQTMFELAGWPQGDLATAQIVELEKRLATAHWTTEQNRDWETLSSNKFDLSNAAERLSNFKLTTWKESAGIPKLDQLVLAQPDYFKALNQIIVETPIETWRHYLKMRVLKTYAAYLSRSVRLEAFRFDQTVLRGQTETKPRAQLGIEFVSDLVPDLIDRGYASVHYSERLAKYTHAMIDQVRTAFRQSIEEARWLSAATKREAFEKLRTMKANIGKPDLRRDYTDLVTKPDQLVENLMNVRRFHHLTLMSTLSRPAEPMPSRTKSQNVNGQYSPAENTFTLGVALLQPPMFSGDHAHNYGSLGATIGHEISHGFDDQGRKFKSDGQLGEWWTDAELEHFRTATEMLVSQYDRFQPLPLLNVNGRLTLGENIADLVGLRMAYRAFKLSKYADADSISGFTPDQRFFIGYALFYRLKMREPFLREFVNRGPHAPFEYRVNGVLRNMPEFYEAFDVKPDDGMYLEKTMRASVW